MRKGDRCDPNAPRLLSPEEARASLAHRLTPLVDRLRFRTAVKFGLRPYNVAIVWVAWSGSERGEGVPVEVRRTPIVPSPKIEDLSAITLDPRSGGVLPVGSIRVSQISGSFTRDELSGLWSPERSRVDHIAPRIEFYWEVTEDGRSGGDSVRAKFRPMSAPARRPDQVDWTIVLERVSEDSARDGSTNIGTDRVRED